MHIRGLDNHIVFEEKNEILDININIFLKRMLLDTHTIAKSKKIFRREARKVFVKEITRNLTETSTDGTKLMQNYCALLIVSKFLTVKDR
jgi:hypothetical protein